MARLAKCFFGLIDEMILNMSVIDRIMFLDDETVGLFISNRVGVVLPIRFFEQNTPVFEMGLYSIPNKGMEKPKEVK